MPSDEPTPKLVAVAEVARPHGVRGELRLELYNPDSELLLGRPAATLLLPGGGRRACELLTVRRAPRALLVRLAGVESREAAEGLRGAQLAVDRAAFGPLGADEYYFCDLEGCEVRVGDVRLGRVHRVMTYPSCEVLVVERQGSEPLEVPFTERYLRRVDIAARSIMLSTIDDLQ